MQAVYEEEEDKKEEEVKDDDLEVWQNGFTGRAATFSTESKLTAEDRGTQQMLFDRLPLSKSDRALFYSWLVDSQIKHNNEDVDAPDVAVERTCENHVERIEKTVPDPEPYGH